MKESLCEKQPELFPFDSSRRFVSNVVENIPDTLN